MKVIKTFFLIFILFNSLIYAKSKYKNLYIEIEPTPLDYYLDAKNKKRNDILDISKKTVIKIVEWAKRKRIKHIYINGKNFKSFRKTKKDDLYQVTSRFVKKIIKDIERERNYNIGKILGKIHSHFKDLQLSADDTIFIYIGDVTIVKQHDVNTNSHGKYLNHAWLKNPNSPLVKNFLKADNTNLKSVPLIIVNRTELNIYHQKKREDFLIELFEKAGLDVYYITTPLMAIKLPGKINHITRALDLLLEGKLDKLKLPNNMDNSIICQFVSENTTETIKDCRR